MPETIRRRAASPAGSMLVELRALDPDTLLTVGDLANLGGCSRRAILGWLRRVKVPRANTPGIAHVYRAASVAEAIAGAGPD